MGQTYKYKPSLEFVTPQTELDPIVRSIHYGPDGPNCPGFLIPFKSLTHDSGVPIRKYSITMCGNGSEFYYGFRFTNAVYGSGNYITLLLTKSLSQPRCDVFIVDFIADTPIYSWRWHFPMNSPRFDTIQSSTIQSSSNYGDGNYNSEPPHFQTFEGSEDPGFHYYFFRLLGIGNQYLRPPYLVDHMSEIIPIGQDRLF